MGVYEKYCGWPEWLRWVLFLPMSLIGSTVIALLMSIILGQDALRIVVDLGYPLLWHALFIGSVFYTVPRRKMGWAITFVSLRVISAILYIIWGLVSTLILPDRIPDWEIPGWSDYWKQGVAEVIVVIGSIGVLATLKESLPDLQREISTEINEY
ncbi:hypothetical protein P4E94_19220 [Pontiellaceae bacterium B12219]|nr:hypothetical protein [Pontiellaceae bacterium B12219]